MDSTPSSGNKSHTRYADRPGSTSRHGSKTLQGGSEIVPQKLSSHLSKKYATLPPANWAMVATSGAVASCPAKLGPRPEGLRMRVKISSPGPPALVRETTFLSSSPTGCHISGTEVLFWYSRGTTMLVLLQIGHGSRSVSIMPPFLSKYEGIVCPKCSHTTLPTPSGGGCFSRSGFFPQAIGSPSPQLA